MSDLTPRELQILRLVSDGLTNQQIATMLWVTENTVKTTLRRLRLKLGAKDRAHAVGIAYRRGVLTTDEETT